MTLNVDGAIQGAAVIITCGDFSITALSMLIFVTGSYSLRNTASRRGVSHASAIRCIAAKISGFCSRRALRIVAAFQTKMPLFQ